MYYFYLEVSVRRTARELKLSYGSVQLRFMHFRKYITKYCLEEAKKLNGELELDETYFGGRRKGKRGRGANNKAIAFGILERKDKVYTIIVPNVREETLMQAIKEKTKKVLFSIQMVSEVIIVYSSMESIILLTMTKN